ncbi:MAG: alpha/beta hydrolase [Planctomycetota bacterium]|nr:MAG: alpha/beta hydrolase [Planctomycetota bacterium]
METENQRRSDARRRVGAAQWRVEACVRYQRRTHRANGARFAAAIAGGVLMASMATAGIEMKRVQFVVVTPDPSDLQPTRIYLASSRDRWRPDGRSLERVADGVYCGLFEFESNLTLEYKFTRAGTWETVEKSAEGGEIPNRVLHVEPELEKQIVVQVVESWADRGVGTIRIARNAPGGQRPAARQNTLTGDIRFHYLFHSPQLKNARTIAVYLPPGYDDHLDERYPVLYMHDGNNIFDARTAFAGVEWNADETAERLISAGAIRPLIIVGIYNTAARIDEYTPWPSPRGDGRGGRADDYLAFIVETLKPFIDETYRTLPGREDTGVAGSSLGGLVSLYAVFRHPRTFGRAGVISPSLRWANGRMLDYVRQAESPKPLRMWIDMGTAESGEPGAPESPEVAACRELTKALIAKSYRPEADFHLEIVENGRHNEADWALRFGNVLEYLYPPQPKPRRGRRPRRK